MPEPSWEAIVAALETERQKPGVEIGGPANPTEIAEAESIVGRFPPSYRRFVAEYGWMETPTYVVNGLGDGVPLSLDVVAETLSERNVFEPGLPVGYIAISSDGNGNVYCLRAVAETADAEPPVMFRDHEFGGAEADLEEYAPTFAAMLYERAKWWNT